MLRLACDVGGTFTDLVVGDQGSLTAYKAPTTPDDPVRGVLEVVGLAAEAAGMDRSAFLARAESFTHATTLAINAVLTGRAARTAFLTTEGHRDILLLREGGRLNPYDMTQSFPRPYVPRRLTFEVPERIGAGGEVVRPLEEEAVARIAARLAELEVAAVGVCLLWSVANPAHEERVGEILAKRLPGVAVTLSHRLNPILREYRRASATCIDASLKPLMGAYLRGLEARLRAAGFRGRLLVVTSQGGVLTAPEAAAAPIHTLNSGPSMAPVAGRASAAEDAPGLDAIVADTGGTSYDVSLVRRGRIPWTSETWIGPRFRGHMTGFPSVDVKSIGAGGGSIAWLDEGGLLRVGPQSAGADPGPACYGRGGTAPTVTDCALVLGWLDPARFLGGRMRLDAAAARRAVQAIADALELPVEAAALTVFDVLTQEMVAAIEEITVQQGIDPARAVLVAGGGAAGFNSVAIARRLGCRATLFPPTGAVLSAAGASLSDLVFTDGRIHYGRSDAPEREGVARVLRSLAEGMASFIAAAGGRGEVEWWAEARYPQQTWEIEVPFAGPEPPDWDALAAAFHAAHREMFAVCDPASPVEVLAWRARARCRVREGETPRMAAPSGAAAPGSRRAFFHGVGWAEVPVHAPAALDEGASVRGPAILETAFTTIVLPPQAAAVRLPSGVIEVRA
jgi:N-methylhydantoinase A